MSILDNFVKQVSEQPIPVQTMINMDLSNNPKINKDILFQKIQHNVEMSDEELGVLLKESYEDILKCIFEQDGLQYLQFVSTPRFISTLTKIVSTHSKELQYQTKIYINKLVYDFITSQSPDNLTDESIYMNTLMINLAKIVNENTIRSLIGIGLDFELADYMALARYSSNSEAINIRRVNFIICTNLSKNYDLVHSEEDRLVAEQMVINIYSKIFNKVTNLFEATMFDVYNLDEDWVTDQISEMYSITTLAVLDILNNMKSSDIRTVLMTYAHDYANVFAPNGYSTRVSLRNLSADHDRIRFIVEGLQKDENVYVP